MEMDQDILPEKDELVVATVEDIKPYGAYLYIDDYNIRAYLPIGEVSSRWIKDISDVLKIGQKIVVKVLRIDPKTRAVDVSLKQVNKRDRDRVMRIWKREQRGLQIISELIEELKLDPEEVEEKLMPIIDKKQTTYDALVELVIDPSLVFKLNLPKPNDIISFLKKRIKPKLYIYEVKLKIQCIEKGGVFKIRNTFIRLLNSLKNNIDKLEELTSYNDGTPYYKLIAKSYRPDVIRKKVKPLFEKEINNISKKINIEIVNEEMKVEI